MEDPEPKNLHVLHVGEWPSISDLFLISLSRSGIEKLSIIYRKRKDRMLYRQILEDLLNKALIEASKI